ncbi:MAG: hypothetical protein N2C14_22340 [Planctomycetales bacterium]
MFTFSRKFLPAIRFRGVAPAAVAWMSCVSSAWACPGCKEGIKQGGGDLIGAYQMSIVFMMAMPFLILGGVSGMLYWEVCKARKLQAQEKLASSQATASQQATE